MRTDPQPNHIFRLLLQPNNLRWIILLASVLVFCAILYPGLADTKLNYLIGDVAQRNIKASRDFLIEDRSATETNRADAAAAVLTVYDHDTGRARQTATTIDQAFADMRKILAEAREALAPPPLSEEATKLANADVTTAPVPAESLTPPPRPPCHRSIKSWPTSASPWRNGWASKSIRRPTNFWSTPDSPRPLPSGSSTS